MLIESIIIASANLVHVPSVLLLSICSVESNLVSQINAHDGNSASYGVCQVKLATAKLFDRKASPVRLVSDPSYNSLIAAKYLAKQLNRYKSTHHAIMAYNAGKYKDSKASSSNRRYLKKVLNKMRFYESTITTYRRGRCSIRLVPWVS